MSIQNDNQLARIVANVKTPARAVDYYLTEIRGLRSDTVAMLLGKTDRSVRSNVSNAVDDLDGVEPAEPEEYNSNDRLDSPLLDLLTSGLTPSPAVDYHLTQNLGMRTETVAMLRGTSPHNIAKSVTDAKEQLGEIEEPDKDDE